MRLSQRSQPIVKSAVYAALSLACLCFSASFFPALNISRGTPFLLVAVVSALAMKEGIKYASLFAAVFGALEGFVFGKNALVTILFYTSFAFLCIVLYSSFFTKGFFAWGLYTLGGILLHSTLSLFAPVASWEVSAIELLRDGALDSLLLSIAFSVPIYPLIAKIKAKTE